MKLVFFRDLLLADNRMGDAGVAALCAGLGLLVDLHALNLDGNRMARRSWSAAMGSCRFWRSCTCSIT